GAVTRPGALRRNRTTRRRPRRTTRRPLALATMTGLAGAPTAELGIERATVRAALVALPDPSRARTVSVVGPGGRGTVALKAPPGPRMSGAPFSVAPTTPDGSGPTAPITVT